MSKFNNFYAQEINISNDINNIKVLQDKIYITNFKSNTSNSDNIILEKINIIMPKIYKNTDK